MRISLPAPNLAGRAASTEIEGTFLEVETIAAEHDVDQALAAVRELLNELGVGRGELTTDLYTDAVRAARAVR